MNFVPEAALNWSAGGFSLAVGFYAMRAVGAGVKWLLTFVTGRQDSQQTRLDAGMQDLVEGLRTDLNRLKDEAKADRQEIAEVRKELHQCEKKHAESEAKVTKLEAMMQGYGDARQQASLIIAKEKQEAKS